jgi:hypothetical protein
VTHQTAKAAVKLAKSNSKQTYNQNDNKQQTKLIGCKNGKCIDSATSESMLNIINEKKPNEESCRKLNIHLTENEDENFSSNGHASVAAEGAYGNLTQGQSDSAIENDEYICENADEKKLKCNNNKEERSNDDSMLNKATHKRISNSATSSSASSHYSSLFSR